VVSREQAARNHINGI